MSGRRLLTIGAVALGVGLTAGAAGLVARLLWPSDGAAARGVGGPSAGEVAGYVARVDAASRRLEIAPNGFGFRPIELAVTDDTTIVVHGKQGGLGDLWADMPVRVAWEVRDNVHIATSVFVAGGGRPQPDAPVATEKPSPPTVEKPSPRTVEKPSSRAVEKPSPRAPAALPSPVTSTTKRVPATPQPAAPVRVEPAPNAVTTPPPVSAPRTGVPAARPHPSEFGPTAREASAAVPLTGAGPATPAPAATRGGDDDGSAAIDWLFKQSGR